MRIISISRIYCPDSAAPNQHQLDIGCPETARTAHHQHQLSIVFLQTVRGIAHHQHQMNTACPEIPRVMGIMSISCAVPAWALCIISISWMLSLRKQPGQCASSASEEYCLSGSSRAVRIISISWMLPVRKQPGQCASLASAEYCLSGNNLGRAHYQHQPDIAWS